MLRKLFENFFIQRPLWFAAKKNDTYILEFILWFSRYEYALKNTGFHRTSRTRTYLQPDWDAFIDEMRGVAIPPSLFNILSYLQANRPRRQMTDFMWDETQGEGWELLINSLKCIRNNLFHGGKHLPAKLLSPERDLLLIKYGILIMKEMLPYVPNHVRIHFGQTT